MIKWNTLELLPFSWFLYSNTPSVNTLFSLIGNRMPVNVDEIDVVISNRELLGMLVQTYHFYNITIIVIWSPGMHLSTKSFDSSTKCTISAIVCYTFQRKFIFPIFEMLNKLYESCLLGKIGCKTLVSGNSTNTWHEFSRA